YFEALRLMHLVGWERLFAAVFLGEVGELFESSVVGLLGPPHASLPAARSGQVVDRSGAARAAARLGTRFGALVEAGTAAREVEAPLGGPGSEVARVRLDGTESSFVGSAEGGGLVGYEVSDVDGWPGPRWVRGSVWVRLRGVRQEFPGWLSS